MKKISILFLTGSLTFFATPSFAEENIETVFVETIKDAPTQEPEPTQEPPGMSPGEHAGWVAVTPDGNAVSDVIVCTPEVCGQTGEGSFLELLYGEGTDVVFVLQTLQDPVEASTSSSGVGNVAGYPEATYNFQSDSWSINEENGSVYEVPLAYPGTDLGGNTNIPTCIENCIPPSCSDDPNYLEIENCSENVGEPTEESDYAPTTSYDDTYTIKEKSNSFTLTSSFKNFNKIKINFHKKPKNIKIIAKRWEKNIVHKKIWNIKKDKLMTKNYTFNIPDKFVGWKFIIKNKKNIKHIRLI